LVFLPFGFVVVRPSYFAQLNDGHEGNEEQEGDDLDR
jgi:hypothetical protein